MEVLAPAGDIDSLKAAVLGGASAVYLGGRSFGARAFAGNFDDDGLATAIAFAHSNDVKVYITVNTLVKQSELQELEAYLSMLHDLGADAVIVQDRGAMSIALGLGLPVHASTQMGIHSVEGALWAKEQGISRIILARELSLEEVGKIASEVDIELEVFVHGALCYCISGQCLFSSLAGGRSGNRGMCAQPCRRTYSMGGDRGHLLSTADLASIDAVPELMRLGVASIKIEGRMRSPTYVYLASQAYSNAVSAAAGGEGQSMTEREWEMLMVAFNRGTTGGHLLGADVMKADHPQDRGLLMGEALFVNGTSSESFKGLMGGDGVSLYQGDEKIGGFLVPEDGRLRSPFRLRDGTYMVHKTYDRAFPSIENAIANTIIPRSHARRPRADPMPKYRSRRPRESDVSVYISSLNSLEAVMPYADRVYFELHRHMERARELCEEAGVELVPLLPRFSFEIPDVESKAVMVSTLGQCQRYEDRRRYGHYSLNVMNGLNVPLLYQTTLSLEMNREEIDMMIGNFAGRVEVMAFGRMELMVTRNQLGEGTLVDGSKRRFPVNQDRFGLSHILNSADLLLLDNVPELEGMGVDSVGLDLRRRPAQLCEMVSRAFAERDIDKVSDIRHSVGPVTRGHYLRGVK